MSFHFNYNTLKPKQNNESFAACRRSKALKSTLPPPPSAGVSKQGYSTMMAITQNAMTATLGNIKKRSVTEDEYFDDDEEDSSSKLAYIPAPGSPSNTSQHSSHLDDDPLDAYMAMIEDQVKKDIKGKATTAPPQQPKVVRNDLEEEDDEESYYRYIEENPTAGLLPADDDATPEIEYDADGNPIAPERKRTIEPLPAFDHSQVTYMPFKRNFYVEHEEISKLETSQINDLRQTLNLTVTGRAAPKPVCAFAHFNFEEKLLKAIVRAGFTQPTAIQAQAVPAALLGRDVLGIAQTGSGKTAAFLWPLLLHVADQPPVAAGDGPIALILAPTRELALQIYNDARRWARLYDLRVICGYGGSSKWEQSAALKKGAEIVVATPGRIIDQVKNGSTNLRRVTYLVLDEADRMFELGFEPQVRSVVNYTRADRQTLLFSATFKRKIERLAKDALDDPVRISQGLRGQANMDVTQHALVLENAAAKRSWLYENMVNFLSTGSLLIFVTKKTDAEDVAADLRTHEFPCLLMHGDMEQADRNRVIMSFKRKECAVMVATDVAARGLDIAHIRTVVNFDIARDVDTHTHRVGRTGRAGTKGTSYTLLLEKDKEFAGHIVRNMEEAKQTVSQEVLDLALKSAWYKKARYKRKNSTAHVGGLGLGFVEKARAASTIVSPEVQQDAPQADANVVSAANTTNRFAAMKAAFKAQYMTQFRSADPPTAPAIPVSVSGPAGSSLRKKSRWE